MIFFQKRSSLYKKIVSLLANNHSLNQEEISKGINRHRGRSISEYLNDLVTAGFLTDDFSWSLKTHKMSRLRKYRLSDNYLRFYLKFIEPRKKEIIEGKYEEGSLFAQTQWASIMGLQFENLVIHNRKEILNILEISPSDCLHDGPFFQTTTKKRKGCQIDYLIQTKSAIFLCEIKFSIHNIGKEVIEEMEQKIKKLEIPKHITYRPILIHVGGVSNEVISSEYFDKIIDWCEVFSC
ncbi:MAG: hypothetical protein SNF33_03070 [Candidatus Algichlamydia australiensis]|nr:hypothetical protein [Chlamydiales bacterium]